MDIGHPSTRRCAYCALEYEPTVLIRFLRWALGQDHEWLDRRACPSAYCRGGRR